MDIKFDIVVVSSKSIRDSRWLAPFSTVIISVFDKFYIAQYDCIFLSIFYHVSLFDIAL